MVGFALASFFLICLYVYYRVENKRRDRKYGRPEGQNEEQELEDELSNKTDREIKSFRYVL